MDTPPALPPPKPPLGRAFYINLCAPLLPLGICFLTSTTAGGAKNSDTPFAFLFLALPVILGCTLACAIMVGSRKGAGLGVLTFLGLQILYLAIAFAGCLASFSGANFH